MGAPQGTDERDIEAIGKVIETTPGLLRYVGHHAGNSLGEAENALDLLKEAYPEDGLIRLAHEAVNHLIDDFQAAGFLKK